MESVGHLAGSSAVSGRPLRLRWRRSEAAERRRWRTTGRRRKEQEAARLQAGLRAWRIFLAILLPCKPRRCRCVRRLAGRRTMEGSAASDGADREEKACREAAIAYLRRRGFASASQMVSNQPREIKINEMLTRDYVKVSRFGLHVVPKPESVGYDDAYARLSSWIKERPAEEQRELNLLRFPLFVHCYLALKTEGDGAAAAFLETHGAEHKSGSNPEKRRQVEQLQATAGHPSSSAPIAKVRMAGIHTPRAGPAWGALAVSTGGGGGGRTRTTVVLVGGASTSAAALQPCGPSRHSTTARSTHHTHTHTHTSHTRTHHIERTSPFARWAPRCASSIAQPLGRI